MIAPIPMIGAGGSKAAVVIAVLVGLFVVTAMNQQAGTTGPQKPR